MRSVSSRFILTAALFVTALAYWPGLSGGWLFDDYPNIVENTGLQIHHFSLPDLARAALSSPSSEFKRPLASLTFALNYLLAGLDPYWMKLTNLVIHLLNGMLVFLLARSLLQWSEPEADGEQRARIAAVIAAAWMLLPINLTGVLYTVQRMESLANLFVLVGLIIYVSGRRRMLAQQATAPAQARAGRLGFLACVIAITVPTAVGILAKETAVMLPFYAVLFEWALPHFQAPAFTPGTGSPNGKHAWDKRLLWLFALVLVLPLIAGLTWQLPNVLNSADWASRNFDLHTRLLTEARVVVDYIIWTLLPTAHALSFYHDNFRVSTGLFHPWTTAACILVLMALVAFAIRIRSRRPLIALGIAWFLGCHLLTGTILPLELVYEHRNYFASIGLLLALIPLLLPLAKPASGGNDFRLARRTLLVGLLLLWTGETAMTAMAWGNPLTLAETLAARAPDSPRAQYSLGRTYIIDSQYQPSSPFVKMAYGPLERAAALPGSSILPEQALIFMNARMHLPIKNAWWNSLIGKLKRRKPGVQDQSSLSALTHCARDGDCNLPPDKMIAAYQAALSYPNPSPQLLAGYGDYAWNVLENHALGLDMAQAAVKADPHEPAYHITLARMLVVNGQLQQAHKQLLALEALNIGGRLDGSIANLQKILADASGAPAMH
ncbi:hypothetical protein [Dyella sp. A6]|uniref:hypothetical protein n=1 Tax=Dyella aluminiiresistens TaxID=3069105 RepID=UPI002E78FC03|nr:hypothetical protein [Dyella sp. A6]